MIVKRPIVLLFALLFLGWSAVACQSSPLPTTISSTAVPPTFTPAPTVAIEHVSTPESLTDAEAIDQIKEIMLARGAVPGTERITITSDPRFASLRFESSFPPQEPMFEVQKNLITINAARVLARLTPQLENGIRLAVIPGGEGDVGLIVTVIDGDSFWAWANGIITDQEFVSRWSTGGATRY